MVWEFGLPCPILVAWCRISSNWKKTDEKHDKVCIVEFYLAREKIGRDGEGVSEGIGRNVVVLLLFIMKN